jgi:hypothetical protein
VLISSARLDVELATGEQHVVQRFADIAGFDRCAAIPRDARLGDPPHQLFDKGGADALGPLGGLAYDGIAERQTPAVELDELVAADLVRKRHLDRLVDATGPACQGALKLLRPVGGEDEQDICILLQSIHLVEKRVEQRFLTRAHIVAVARNQIDILDHDHRWLQQAGKIHVMGKQCDLRGRDDQGSVTGQVACQIADGMGLAGTGRSVKQDTLAGQLPQPAQLVAAPDKAQDVAVEQLQCGFGQDHVLALNRWQLVDHDASGASPIIRIAIERQDLAAIATRGVDRALQLGETALHELRAISAGRHGNLDPGPRLIAILPMRGEDDRVAQTINLTEPQAVIETFHRRALADIHIVILRRHYSVSISAIFGQCRDGQCLVAALLVDAEIGSAMWRTACRCQLERRRAYDLGTAARSRPTDPAECRRNARPARRRHS